MVKFKVVLKKTLVYQFSDSKLKNKSEDEIKKIVEDTALKEVWPFKPDHVEVREIQD